MTGIKTFLKCVVITGLALKLASLIVPGIHVFTVSGLVAATILLTLINEYVRPLIVFVTLPLVVVTLGAAYLLLNALVLEGVGSLGFLRHDFAVDTFWAALWGSLLAGFVTVVLKAATRTGGSGITFRRGTAPPPPKNGGGPVIDV